MVKEYGYEYSATINEDLLSCVGWAGTNEKLWGAYSLRSGRDALKMIAREHKNSTVFLPSLCCDSMITPFETFGCEIVFYPLTKQIKVDFQALVDKLKTTKKQKLLLFYDYFSIKMFSEKELLELKSSFEDLIFIEDITHTFLYPKTPNLFNDYTVASLRKWINVPDGGLLWSKRNLTYDVLCDDSTFAKQRLQAQSMRDKYFTTGDEDLKTNYRSIFSSVSHLLDNSDQIVKMTNYSYNLAIVTDWEKVKNIRKENASVLRSVLSKNASVKFICGENENNLYLPILVNNRDEVQNKLSKKGIFNTIIWPLREEQKLSCETAKYVVENMLAVPCDQRYTTNDMSFIANEITRTINE